jgi:hypothetical protein
VADPQARLLATVVLVCATVCTSVTLADEAPKGIKTEFLMTLYAPLDSSENINESLSISNVEPKGGWVRGPRIQGVLISPGGDWSRTLTSGVLRLDVRLTIKTEDGALIYVSYNGIERDSEVTAAKSRRGEALGADDVKYWIIAPTFETSATKYGWLNEIQAVGKMVAYKDGPGGFVKYEIYTVR